jgi:hypothetical protein
MIREFEAAWYSTLSGDPGSVMVRSRVSWWPDAEYCLIVLAKVSATKIWLPSVVIPRIENR